MSRRLLNEEQKNLLGIHKDAFGGLPVVFQPAQYFEKKKAGWTLEEAKTMRMFKDIKEMVNALERAKSLVHRVNATVQSSRNMSGTAMHEKARADMYRLDQELASTLESLAASKEALEGLEKTRRIAEREMKERKRQGR